MPGTILDAHIHTVRGAADSALQPDDLLAEANRIGLTGVNLTEHDRVWERYDWKNFVTAMGEAGVYLNQGMEVSTDLGHIIVFGIDQYYSGIRSAERLREVCDEIGAFMTVAHPFRHFFDPVTFRRKGEEPFSMTPDEAAERMHVFQVVHGIEVGNGGNTAPRESLRPRSGPHPEQAGDGGLGRPFDLRYRQLCDGVSGAADLPRTDGATAA